MLAIMSLTATVPSQWCWAQGSPVKLTANTQDDFGPAWSPDGTKISFEFSRDGDNDIYVIPYGPAAEHGNTERGDRRTTLLNLSLWQAWVHLYCL